MSMEVIGNRAIYCDFVELNELRTHNIRCGQQILAIDANDRQARLFARGRGWVHVDGNDYCARHAGSSYK